MHVTNRRTRRCSGTSDTMHVPEGTSVACHVCGRQVRTRRAAAVMLTDPRHIREAQSVWRWSRVPFHVTTP
jgi:hypothetical protein